MGNSSKETVHKLNKISKVSNKVVQTKASLLSNVLCSQEHGETYPHIPSMKTKLLKAIEEATDDTMAWRWSEISFLNGYVVVLSKFGYDFKSRNFCHKELLYTT